MIVSFYYLQISMISNNQFHLWVFNFESDDVRWMHQWELTSKEWAIFQFFAKFYTKWYERLWHWCTSKKTRLIIFKNIVRSPYPSCLLLDEYWVHEKYAHLYAIFWFPHSKWNHCLMSDCVILSSINFNNSKWEFISIVFYFDVVWCKVNMIMKDEYQECDNIYMFINSYEQSYQFIFDKIESLNIVE